MASIYLLLVARSHVAFSATSLSKCKLPILGGLAKSENCRVLKIVEGKSEKSLLMTFAASPLVFYFMVQPCSLQLDCGGF
jgi:hypothetical protein